MDIHSIRGPLSLKSIWKAPLQQSPSRPLRFLIRSTLSLAGRKLKLAVLRRGFDVWRTRNDESAFVHLVLGDHRLSLIENGVRNILAMSTLLFGSPRLLR